MLEAKRRTSGALVRVSLLINVQMALSILALVLHLKLDRIQKISCYSVVEFEVWVFTYVLSRGIFFLGGGKLRMKQNQEMMTKFLEDLFSTSIFYCNSCMW